MKAFKKRPEKKSSASTENKDKFPMDDYTSNKNSPYSDKFDQFELNLDKVKLVGKQIPHDSALGHVTGEALFVDDITPVKNELIEKLVDLSKSLKVGPGYEEDTGLTPIISEKQLEKVEGYARSGVQQGAEAVHGGKRADREGYFMEATVLNNVKQDTSVAREEIFGPVLTVHIYDTDWESVCKLVDSTSEYALTGAIMSKDKEAIKVGSRMLVNSAGNFYINDKPTGAVVGQQPFGGSRASGTNDKAGSSLNLLRWVSVRTVKETFEPPTNYRYPFMEEE